MEKVWGLEFQGFGLYLPDHISGLTVEGLDFVAQLQVHNAMPKLSHQEVKFGRCQNANQENNDRGI